jgi:hypothetical protein
MGPTKSRKDVALHSRLLPRISSSRQRHRQPGLYSTGDHDGTFRAALGPLHLPFGMFACRLS